jgi:CTP:phosphocholine cytidylyltransferase-like protein
MKEIFETTRNNSKYFKMSNNCLLAPNITELQNDNFSVNKIKIIGNGHSITIQKGTSHFDHN